MDFSEGEDESLAENSEKSAAENGEEFAAENGEESAAEIGEESPAENREESPAENEEESPRSNEESKSDRKGSEGKETIELDLGVSRLMEDESALSENPLSDDGFKESDEEEMEMDLLEQPVIDISPSNHSDLIAEAKDEKSQTEKTSPEEKELEEISSKTSDRREQSIQSSHFDGSDFNYNVQHEFCYKESMLNALLHKSPVFQERPNSNEIQVTIFLPDNKSITDNYSADINVEELKRIVSERLGLDPAKFLITLMGSGYDYISDWTPLLGIPPNSVGGLVLSLSYKFDMKVKNVVNFPNVETYAPIITVRKVRVQNGAGKEKIVTVVTEDISYIKEWLGGYKNIQNGLIYHNAATETRSYNRKPKIETPISLNSRDAQTHLPYVSNATQSDAIKSTQMWRQDHYITSADDRIVVAKPYTEYDLLAKHKVVLDSVIKIQRWFRHQLTRRNTQRAFSKLIQLIRKQREKNSAMEADLNREKIDFLISICFPTTRGDFFNLYSIIGKWWKNEYKWISNIRNKRERQAAYYNLLLSEIDLLSALERLKIKSKAEALDRLDKKLVEETSRPVIRQYRQGHTTIIETLEVQRAREIKEMYMTCIRTDVSKKERINILFSIISIVETFDEIDFTGDLIKLMHREIDMINMGIDDSCLLGLRKRIEEGIYHFIRDKDFNPRIRDFKPVHFPRVSHRSHRCKGCGKLKLPQDFPIHVRLKEYWNCKACEWIRLTSYNIVNIAPYASILKLLKANEMSKCSKSSFCFVLQPFGAYTIINTIWNGKSALSEYNNLPELRLCRWDNKIDWSPWNTILLTEEEADVHQRIEDLEEIYEPDFIQSIKLKHLSAKFHFNMITDVDEFCREAGHWDSAIDNNIHQNKFRRRENLELNDPAFKAPPKKAFLRDKSRSITSSHYSHNMRKSKPTTN